ncbi:MAG TPA: hypothetical protein VGB08_01265 [Allosphingosinicella sp.]|jgi:hypothetical protein
MSGPGATFLSILMLAAFALVVGGIAMIRRGRERSKGVLMLVAAAVLAGNVAILAL